jgi:serine protease Do
MQELPYPVYSWGLLKHHSWNGIREDSPMSELRSQHHWVSGRQGIGLLFVCLSFFVPILSGSARAQLRPLDELRRLDESVGALIKRVSPSVVQILVTGYGPLDEAERGNAGAVIGRQRAIGSGFIIDADGYIITNAHVVNGAQRVQVVLPLANADVPPDAALSSPTNIAPARIIGVTREIDLALLKVEAKNLPPLPLANYRNLRQGEAVFAFGSPEGLRNTVTHGVISAVARQTDPDSPLVYVQTDAAINPGNSDDPVVNVNGEVVGVNTFILSQSGGNEGLCFAIPSGVVSVVYKQLRKFGHLHRSENWHRRANQHARAGRGNGGTSSGC